MEKGGKQMTKIDEDLVEEIHACIADKKSPGKCIDRALEDHGIDLNDKAEVLTKVMKEDAE